MKKVITKPSLNKYSLRTMVKSTTFPSMAMEHCFKSWTEYLVLSMEVFLGWGTRKWITYDFGSCVMFLKFAINLLALSLREIVPITSKDLQTDGPISALSDLTAGFFFKQKLCSHQDLSGFWYTLSFKWVSIKEQYWNYSIILEFFS